MSRKLSAIVFCLFLVLTLDTFLSDVYAFNVITVGASGSTDEKTTFGYNETPWLYIDVPEYAGAQGFYPKLTVSAGAMLQSEPYTIAVIGFNQDLYPNGFQDTWVQFDQWDSIRQAGTWNVDSQYYIYTLNGYTPNFIEVGSDTTSFQVQAVPEPASLLLLGSGLLGLFGLNGRRLKR